MTIGISRTSNKYLQTYVAEIRTIFHDECSILLYGSSIFKEGSDLDICTLVEKYNQRQRAAVAQKTIDFHKRHGLRLDFDVPYSQKTLYSFSDLERAVSAHPFEFVGGSFSIPDIIMNQKFLSSDKMKERLALNVLTTKHELLWGSAEKVAELERHCWHTIIRLIFSHLKNQPLNHEEFIDHLGHNPYTGKSFKKFLGYDTSNFLIKDYLDAQFTKFSGELLELGLVEKLEDKFICTQKWLDELLFQRLELVD